MSDADLPDQMDLWAERLQRVVRSQARTNIAGMRRPPRNPDERVFLEERGLLGPFPEDANLPGPSLVRKRKPA